MEFEPYAGEGITIPEIVTGAADKHGIPQNIAHALIGEKESGYDPYAKNPKSSASGLGQIINRTGKSLGMNITGGPDDDRWHPVINAEKSMEYLASLYQKTGSWDKALARYGEGPQYARSVLRAAKVAATVGEQIEFEPYQPQGESAEIEFESYVPGKKRSKFDYTPEEEAAAEAEIDRYVAGRKPKPELDATSETLAQFAEPAGEMVGKAAFLPFVPLEWGVHQVGRAVRPLMVQSFPKATPEEIDMALGGMETVGTLGLMPAYARLIIKGVGMLAQVGRPAFYRYAPDFIFKPTAEVGLPAVTSPGQLARQIKRMSPEQRQNLVKQYPQFERELTELWDTIPFETKPPAPGAVEVPPPGVPPSPGIPPAAPGPTIAEMKPAVRIPPQAPEPPPVAPVSEPGVVAAVEGKPTPAPAKELGYSEWRLTKNFKELKDKYPGMIFETPPYKASPTGVNRIYTVYIDKTYFPKELQPKGIAEIAYEIVKVKADSRTTAALRAWDKMGRKWLNEMAPLETTQRKISLHVDEPSAASYDRGVKYMGGGAASRLSPIEVLRISQPEPAPAPKEPGKKMYGGGPETTEAVRAVIDDTAGIIRGAPPRIKDAHAYIKETGPKLWEWYKSPFVTKERGFYTLLNKYLGARQIAGFENRKFLNKIQTAIPRKVTREGLTNWIQAGGDETLLRIRANKSEGTLKAGYEAALRLTPEEKVIAAEISTRFDQYLKDAQEAGIIEDGLENYVTQLWERGAHNKAELRRFRSEINAGLLNTNFNYAKQRIFESYFAGEQKGYIPKNKDVAFLLGNYHQSMYEAIAARRAIKAMIDGKADDGLPLVSVSGMGKQIMAREEGLPFEKVSPEYDMTEAKGPETYLIFPKAIHTESADGRRYMPIDHPALRKWKWVSNDPEGKPILLQGNMYVHPDIYKHLKNVLGRSVIREHPLGRGALAVSQNLKGILLSGVPTPFHQVHLGSHAIFHKINPFTCPEIDFKDPLQRKAVEHGLMVYSHNALSEFAEGLQPTGLAQKVPGIGRVTLAYGEYLFQDLIPRFKMKLFIEAYERNTERYGKKYTDDQIAEITANQSNAAFGELNYKAMGRNPTMQDAFRLMALAPDFLEARLRFAGQALKPGGKEQATALLRAIIGMYGVAVIGNMLFSDDRKPHWDKPFTAIIGKTSYALRSVPGDIIHLINDPRSFVYHRLNPATAKPLVEWLSQRDVFGRKRDMWDQIGDYFRGVVPIPLQGLVSKGERTLLQGVFQSLGLSSYKYRTKTEKIMLDYQTAHRIDWSPEEAKKREPFYKEKRDLLKKTEGQKEAFESGLKKLRTKFDLTLRRTKNIRAQFNDELKYRFNVVKDIDIAIKAYDAGTPQEKEVLRKPLQKKLYNLAIRDPAKFKANNYKDKLKELRK